MTAGDLATQEGQDVVLAALVAMEAKQDSIIAALVAMEAKQDSIIAAMGGAHAVGVPIGSPTTSAAAWDNGGDTDLGAAHTYKLVRVTAIEDTYIVVSDVATDPATVGEFVPAGSVMVFPCAGNRYLHHKAVTVAGVIGITAFAAA